MLMGKLPRCYPGHALRLVYIRDKHRYRPAPTSNLGRYARPDLRVLFCGIRRLDEGQARLGGSSGYADAPWVSLVSTHLSSYLGQETDETDSLGSRMSSS